MEKEKVGICIICGNASPVSELDKIQEYNEITGELERSIGWVHEMCFFTQLEDFEDEY